MYKLVPRWVCFSVRLNFSTFCRKNFRDDLSTGVRAFDWMEIIIRKLKLAEDRTRSPYIAERYLWHIDFLSRRSNRRYWVLQKLAKMNSAHIWLRLVENDIWKGGKGKERGYLQGWHQETIWKEEIKKISARGDQENIWKKRSSGSQACLTSQAAKLSDQFFADTEKLPAPPTSDRNRNHVQTVKEQKLHPVKTSVKW